MTEDNVTTEPQSLMDSFVFMEKTIQVLDIGLKVGKNVVLHGLGGHGKSEIALEFFYEKGIRPYVITMGAGMTADRLFGGVNIPILEKEGKIEYLCNNSFMNHEYVIFEEMMDAPDYLLEELKDILSSGEFRNGTQIYPIKTRFIVGNTNKLREEFAKNLSLKALMERFPLEHNVIWDNYNDLAYNKLLETRFGVGKVNPIIPFILQEYNKQGLTISPRIALDCYEVFEECGPDALMFFADFAKKPTIIQDALKKFEATIRFRVLGGEISELVEKLDNNNKRTQASKEEFVKDYKGVESRLLEIKSMNVTDDLAQTHAILLKKTSDDLIKHVSSYGRTLDKLADIKAGIASAPFEEKEEEEPNYSV